MAVVLDYRTEDVRPVIAANGADGIAVEIHNLPPELRTVDTFKTLVDEVPLPFMFICCRNCQWYGSDDEARRNFSSVPPELFWIDQSLLFT